jgi:hypothetical protein
VLSSLCAVACGSGDNSAIRSFYPTVVPGPTLVDAVIRAEKAQKHDVALVVTGMECPADTIEIGQSYGHPYIRVTEKVSDGERSAEPSYSQSGYSTPEEFTRALSSRLPPFYACRTFVFTFSRDQVWPVTDSFTVSVDTNGSITSVSKLKEDGLGE